MKKEDSEIKNEIEENEEDLIKKVDKIEEPPVLKVEICSGAGEWAIAQVCCGQNNKFRKLNEKEKEGTKARRNGS